MTTTEEVWRDVVGFEDSYEVSDLGRVRSKDRVRTYRRVDQYSGKTLEVVRMHKGKLLRPGPSNAGHLSVVLGRRNTKSVHVLVLEAFVGPRPGRSDGCHINDLPHDNRLENLRWGTRTENLHDAVRNGRKPVGSRTHNAKLSDDDARAILSAAACTPQADLARQYGVAPETVRQVITGRTWKHVRETTA